MPSKAERNEVNTKKKRKPVSPELDYLLKAVDSANDGLLERGDNKTVTHDLIRTGLLERSFVKSRERINPARTRIYATDAGRKAAALIREAQGA